MNYGEFIAWVNRKTWWHVVPQERSAYKLRGKFYASTYKGAEFYGRPQDVPDLVKVSNPLVSDEATIETTLFGRQVCDKELQNK
jgi:hypothetical protein